LDDLARRVDGGFHRLEARIDGLDARIDGLGDSLGRRIDALQMTLVRVGGGVIIGLVGVIAAVIARG
jgi:hypothetical protein